ncbi:MAG: DUF2752 domain-containing protein [Lachnospiraceae bacterium]|nr:DUF2752 domain-containing protein [Lachnospiraceae bacterium]
MSRNLPYSSTTIKIIWKIMNGQMPCVFQELTGLYCPGCGGTRALKALLKGDVITSILYHPLILYVVFVAVLFAFSYLIYAKTKNPKFRLHFDNKYAYIGIGIIVINFVIKNYYLIFEATDLLQTLPPV